MWLSGALVLVLFFFLQDKQGWSSPYQSEAEESCEEEEEGEDKEENGTSGKKEETAKHKQIFIQELLLASLSLGNSLEEQEQEDSQSWVGIVFLF
jgi:hypothetical protein